jgi:hypothetical protein
MNKTNLEEIKLKVASGDVSSIIYEFRPPLTQEDLAKIRSPKTWKVMYREKQRIAFNCVPFDDQLRCYVTLDTAGNIVKIVYSAE